MRAQPLGPSVELLWGHETCERCAEMGVGAACGRSRWALRWSSLWGHETSEGCAEIWRRCHENITIVTIIVIIIMAHPSHVSWPHRELHLRPPWRSSHAAPPPFSARPSRVSLPHRELHHRRRQWQCSDVGAARVSAQPSRISWPHKGAPPKAPVAVLTCGRHPLYGSPLRRFVAPEGAPPKMVLTAALLG